MNFVETMKSVELVLEAGQVPLLVGETGIGKTSLAHRLAVKNGWSLVTIDGNLLKEGEIGGLPTVDSFTRRLEDGSTVTEKVTVYAIHYKLKQIADKMAAGHQVVLFIDEINRCEHAVQQELMNLILNREINGFVLGSKVHIVAAMNPTNSYDYQTVEMDVAQQNRFVWLHMEPDYMQWLDWAAEAHLEPMVMEFISTYPEYLHKMNDDDIYATPRSYERVSALYAMYKRNPEAVGKDVFFNVIRGNVGKVIAREFISFVEADHAPLISFDDVFKGDVLSDSVKERLGKESHTRLYLTAKNLMRVIELRANQLFVDTKAAQSVVTRFMEFMANYPEDLQMAVMKDVRNNFPRFYEQAIENDNFVNAFFDLQRSL
ncbi:MAG: AAA family ATPase [Veillonella sp.]|uniref:AAA family ATPase n=1 Tax=Veillonella sp. TaxID=1926307 RepID=UPI002600295C|nr:AAA family ATPase [Veillonella sp.]MBS4914042.1 AAA family ATPase [Veillonella sp.]